VTIIDEGQPDNDIPPRAVGQVGVLTSDRLKGKGNPPPRCSACGAESTGLIVSDPTQARHLLCLDCEAAGRRAPQ
jgi:hypothetical protein